MFFKIFAAHCFHEIFRVSIFSIQIFFKGSFQSCYKSLINQACSGPYWENIGPRSFLYGPRCARSILSRPWADILPVRPSRLVNNIYISSKSFSIDGWDQLRHQAFLCPPSWTLGTILSAVLNRVLCDR